MTALFTFVPLASACFTLVGFRCMSLLIFISMIQKHGNNPSIGDPRFLVFSMSAIFQLV